jgi:hypothetical protein
LLNDLNNGYWSFMAEHGGRVVDVATRTLVDGSNILSGIRRSVVRTWALYACSMFLWCGRRNHVCDEFYFMDFTKKSRVWNFRQSCSRLYRNVFAAVIGQLPERAEADKTLAGRNASGKELMPFGMTFLISTDRCCSFDCVGLWRFLGEICQAARPVRKG